MNRSGAVRGSLVTPSFVRRLLAEPRAQAANARLPVVRRQFTNWQRRVAAVLGPASGLAAIHDVGAVPLARLLGYSLERLAVPAPQGILLSRLRRDRLPPMVLAITPWSDGRDTRPRAVLRAAAPFHPRWVVWFNGPLLRLLDPGRALTERYLEFELGEVAREADALDILWTVMRADAFVVPRAAARAFIDDIVDASARHGRHVARQLQQGVREALSELAVALGRAEPRRRTTSSGIVEQALTLVFRLLFLLFAEARALVPVWHPVYRHNYLVEALRRHADDERCDGLWEGLQAISRLAHEGCELDDLRVTPFNGQLFAPEKTPLGEAARIGNETMRRVLRSLSAVAGDRPEAVTRTLVAYGELDVEELGAVYERLLDASPEVERTLERRIAPPPGRSVSRVSTRRKESGTFYTPREMADYLVRETLTPLVRGASADEILSLRVLDPAMGSGAFLVAACRFLADAYEQALDREGRTPRATPLEHARAGYRRLVAQRCLFGVDVNPVAAGLARLSLWLATLAGDAPLTFLDHHLRIGNSLLGASVDDLARGWRATRGPSTLASRGPQPALPLVEGDTVAALMRDLVPLRARLAGPDESAAIVRDKDLALERLFTSGLLARLLALADAWCAWFSWPGPEPAPPRTAWAELTDHALHGRSRLPGSLGEIWLDTARRGSAARRYFHWQLQFPEVFFTSDGTRRPDAGFDAIVGNPPWDMVRADVRDVDIGGQSKRDAAELTRFVRESGVYQGTRDGHVNRYQLFIERALDLVRHGGRIGLVAPWGLACDHSAAPVRVRLLERCDTESIVGFENAEAIFPIHRSQRFLLFTTTTGGPTRGVRCRLGARSVDVLTRSTEAVSGDAPRDAVVLTPAFLKRVSGEGLEIPWIRGADDLALVDAIDRASAPLGAVEGWHVSFGRELNATDDRRLFGPAGSGLPVVDGRHLAPFAVRLEACERAIDEKHVPALLERLPGLRRPRLAYRDVSSATNRLTLIAAILPARVASTHTVFCLRTRIDADSQWCLCALLNSFVANYLVRLRVTSHVTVAMMAALRVPTLDRQSPVRAELIELARGLSKRETTSDYARLQALAARAYKLQPSQFAHIVSTFPLIDVRDREAALAEFEQLQ